MRTAEEEALEVRKTHRLALVVLLARFHFLRDQLHRIPADDLGSVLDGRPIRDREVDLHVTRKFEKRGKRLRADKVIECKSISFVA